MWTMKGRRARMMTTTTRKRNSRTSRGRTTTRLAMTSTRKRESSRMRRRRSTVSDGPRALQPFRKGRNPTKNDVVPVVLVLALDFLVVVVVAVVLVHDFLVVVPPWRRRSRGWDRRQV